ncbi:hypothetical protein FCIRC_7050 [Fusarium circinatum]|uniref:Uncharacterized protein n=1 Tax=Fusarium circinatum TaxID=48490 RepID=A0A8H5TUQ9_FUSCI|nr:hypothetical protein FCIRC_7050 [Fusarium circinatum]
MPPRMDIYRRGRQLERLSNTGHALLNSLLHNDDLHYFAVCEQRFPDPHEEQYPADWVDKDKEKLRSMLNYWRSKMRKNYYFTIVNGTRQLKAQSGPRPSSRRMRRCGYTYPEACDLPSPREEDMNEYLQAETEAMRNHEYYDEGEEREIDYA